MWELVFAAEEAASEGAAPPSTSPFANMAFVFVAFFLIMWFLLIRPERKRDKQRREMLAAVSKGDSVVTSGGVCGTVVGLTDKTAVIRVSDDPVVKMEFLRGAISQVTSRKDK